MAERFTDPSVRQSVEVDLDLIDHLDESIGKLELYLTRTAKVDDIHTCHRLKTVPGVGPILGLVLLCEMHDLRRFPTVGDFRSYARLVRLEKESGGKKLGFGNKKIGNAHLRWALGEAVCLFLRGNETAQKWLAPKEAKHGAYPEGVRLTKQAMKPYEARLELSKALPKYDIVIRPSQPRCGSSKTCRLPPIR